MKYTFKPFDIDPVKIVNAGTIYEGWTGANRAR